MLELAKKVIELKDEYGIFSYQILVVVSEKRAAEFLPDNIFESFLLPYRVKVPIEHTKKFVADILDLEESGEDVTDVNARLTDLATNYSKAFNLELWRVEKKICSFKELPRVQSFNNNLRYP